MPLSDEAKVAIEVLALEYSALRADILHRSAARFSMLSVALGVFTVLIALVTSDSRVPGLVTVITAAVYLVVVGLSWLDAGRSIGRLSNRIVEIEGQINGLTGDAQALLKWEGCEQGRRNWLNRLVMGGPA